MDSISELWQPVKKQPIERILGPFQRFLHTEASGGILLLLSTVIALVLANSPLAHDYHAFLERKLDFSLGRLNLNESIHHWINDGLMAVFFFVVGLEIKREILVGELSKPREAALPIAAALGGMILPAAIYTAVIGVMEPDKVLNMRGWGIPMATDIAFSLGILALVGSRVPVSAKIFLTAFAIVDDIGASMVIAIFYTDQIVWPALGGGLVIFLIMIGTNALGVRRALPFAILGFFLWAAFLRSGIHPTIAGILGAMTIPARTRINSADFLASCRIYLKEFEEKGMVGTNVLTNRRQRAVLEAMETKCEQAQTPLQRLEHGLHPWVAFFIMPIFALANAGVTFSDGIGGALNALISPVSIGIILGLVLGKTIGVVAFSWLAVRTGIARLPTGIGWPHIFGISWLGAIGFTMALFIAGLAFKTDDTLLDSAKVGILAASVIAGVTGFVILRSMKWPPAAMNVDESQTEST